MTRQEAVEYGMRWKHAICDRGDTEFSEAVQFLNVVIEASETRATIENEYAKQIDREIIYE